MVSGHVLAIGMSKKCTPLWCEAHSDVNMLKTPLAGTTFGHSRYDKDNYSYNYDY